MLRIPTGRLLCTRCCVKTSSPRSRMRTAKTERTRPPRPDTPSCPSTTAGCSTPGATSSMRTADACPPYPGDHGVSRRLTRHSSCLTPSQKRVLRARFHLHCPTLCTLCFKHHILLASHSHFPFSHAWSCSCVSRAMFPETEQQTVSQMMATESNYPPAVLSAWWWGSGFPPLAQLTTRNISSDPWHPFPSFPLPVDSHFSVPSVSCDEGNDSRDQFSWLKTAACSDDVLS